MDYIIYVLAGVSILLGLGGFQSYRDTKYIGLLLSSLVSIGFGFTAIILIQWWPLVVGFLVNCGLRFLGLDPSHRVNK